MDKMRFWTGTRMIKMDSCKNIGIICECYKQQAQYENDPTNPLGYDHRQHGADFFWGEGDCPECAGDDGDCQHKSQEIIHDDDCAEIALCTWTCGELLINFKQDEDGHQWRLSRLRQLAMSALDYAHAMKNLYSDDEDKFRFLTAVSEGAQNANRHRISKRLLWLG